ETPHLVYEALDPGQFSRTLAGEEVIERQHGVGLSAPEVGLELNDGIASIAVQAAEGRGEEMTESLGDVGPLEELLRLPILGGRLSSMDLAEIGGELSLLVPTGGHVGVGGDDLPPGLVPGSLRALDRRRRDPAPLLPCLLL